jgi:3-deoxy-7-phosphoheptulonate synthase
MPNRLLENLNIAALDIMPSPEEIHARVPMSEKAAETVFAGRETIKRILDRKDHRLFIVAGPCSIHDAAGAYDYAERLKTLADEVSDTFALIMRVYFEKPRTSIGWKGFINDPRMDDSFHIEEGMQKARAFLMQVAELGLPAATEALDPIAPQYLGDLISWTAIGARTSESQTHREIASGLSTPVGFKNGTDGNIDVAINGMISAARPHSFLGINSEGRSSIVRTRGNSYAHIVLRGGDRPNYDTVSISIAERSLLKVNFPPNIVVDCSHANCFKDHNLQCLVVSDCVHQIRGGNRSIVGLMLESNIEGGNQPIPADLAELKYGCSVTDPCIDWPSTENTIRQARDQLKEILPHRGT